MHTAILLSIASLSFIPSIVRAIPASPPPEQLIKTSGLSYDIYTEEQCAVHPPAPLSDCLHALAQFPTSGDGVFHPATLHDPNANYSMGQVRKSGQCRIFVNSLVDGPIAWSWVGDDGLLSTVRSLLDTCTADQAVPMQQQVTGGGLIVHFMYSTGLYPVFRIRVVKTAVVLEDDPVDVT